MKKICFLSSIFINCLLAYSQEAGIVFDKELLDVDFPKQLIVEIEKELPGQLIGVSVNALETNTNYFDYTIYVRRLSRKGIIKGEVVITRACANCSEPEQHELSFEGQWLYCCKDDSHEPNETAKTKEEMQEIQQKNQCDKIGFCVLGYLD